MGEKQQGEGKGTNESEKRGATGRSQQEKRGDGVVEGRNAEGRERKNRKRAKERKIKGGRAGQNPKEKKAEVKIVCL